MLFWIKNDNKNRIIFDTDTYETMIVTPPKFSVLNRGNDIQLAHNYTHDKNNFCALCLDKEKNGSNYILYIYKGTQLYGKVEYNTYSNYESIVMYETRDGDFDIFLNRNDGTDAFHCHANTGEKFKLTLLDLRDRGYFSTNGIVKSEVYASHTILKYAPTGETFLTTEGLMMRYIERTDSYKLMEVNDSQAIKQFKERQIGFIKTVIVPKVINIIRQGILKLRNKYKDFKNVRQRTTSDLLNYYCAEALQREITPLLKVPICFIYIQKKVISLHVLTLDSRGNRLMSYIDIIITDIIPYTNELFQ